MSEGLCNDCVSGEQKEGTPAGRWQKIGKWDVYVSQPADQSCDKGILYMHDAFGTGFINNQLQADIYAKAGYLVVAADYLREDAVPIGVMTGQVKFDFVSWFPRGGLDTKYPEVKESVPVLKGAFPQVKKWATIGFCWGGGASLRLGGTDMVESCAAAHPSFLKVPEDVEAIKKPALFICADMDEQLPQEKREASQKIMKAKEEKEGLKSKFVYYPGTRHGFAIRGVMSDEVSVKASQDAIDQVINWWKETL